MIHGESINSYWSLDRLEAWDADEDGTGMAWEAKAWVGSDLNRLWLRSEGERAGGSTESADVEVLYGRAIAPWWDAVAGVRHDFGFDGGPSRTYAALGVIGLAPYKFEVEATAYVGESGQVGLGAEAEYEMLFTNRLTIELSFAGAALAAIYPFTKRWTYLPQVVLGAAFGWSIPMAFAAVAGSVPPVGWLLFIGNILWSVIYDTEYAMVDRDDDLKAGAKSTAILFGDADVPILGMLMGTFLLAMLFVGQRAGLGWPYWLALLISAGLFGYQLWLIRDRLRDACLAAFRHNNWLGLAVWIGIVLALAVR